MSVATDTGITVLSLKDAIKQYKLEIPTTGSIRIKPFKNSVGADEKAKSRTWGTVRRSGWFRIVVGSDAQANKEVINIKEWNYMGLSLELHGSGMLLNMENAAHRNLFAIFMFSENWRGVVVKNGLAKTHNSRFFVYNPEAEATAYLKSVEVQDEMIDMLRELNDTQLPLFGLIFNIKGSPSLIRATLRQMTGTPANCKKIAEILLSPDREVMETIAVAESKANPNASNESERGLFKKHTGIYYWNDVSLGNGLSGCIAYLKNKPDLYIAIRQLYFGEKPGEQKPVATAPIDPVEKLFKDQQDTVVNCYNGGTTDVKAIAKETGVNYKRVEKILRDSADRLKK